MIVSEAVADQIRALPERPGIYVFKDAGGRPLYIGKAKSLRKRGMSYTRREQLSRIGAMLAEAASLDCVVTDTEAEALLLENSWIKRHQPRHNVLLRDDKTYPYLKLTLQDETPKIAFTRRLLSDGAEYFGPYLPGGLARKAIKLVQKLFQVRVCHIEIDGRLPRPCLYYDMRRCLGPCVSSLTTKEKYDRAVADARDFLSGRTDALLQRLRSDMQRQAERLEFEAAARTRDVIHEIEVVSQKRKLSSVRGEDVDIYGVFADTEKAAVSVLVMRGGQVLDRREYFFEQTAGREVGDLLSELLPQIYDRTSFIPKEIHLPEPIDGEQALIEWLSERKQERVYVRLPTRGPKAQRVHLALKNARLAFQRRFRLRSTDELAAQALQQRLSLLESPRRIEGFDISTFHGDATVASLVVWEEGRMLKRDYRSFNIATDGKSDDFASMREAVLRRYRRVLAETGDLPDLILIDGGRGQLNSALEALAELGVEETPVVGLAKREEELFLPARPEPLTLDRNDPGLKLLQRIRDEAHRFAISRHRKQRDRKTLTSRLDSLKGVGPGRRRLLLKTFGSVEQVRQADLQQLQNVLGRKVGRSVFEQLRMPAP